MKSFGEDCSVPVIARAAIHCIFYKLRKAETEPEFLE